MPWRLPTPRRCLRSRPHAGRSVPIRRCSVGPCTDECGRTPTHAFRPYRGHHDSEWIGAPSRTRTVDAVQPDAGRTPRAVVGGPLRDCLAPCISLPPPYRTTPFGTLADAGAGPQASGISNPAPPVLRLWPRRRLVRLPRRPERRALPLSLPYACRVEGACHRPARGCCIGRNGATPGRASGSKKGGAGAAEAWQGSP